MSILRLPATLLAGWAIVAGSAGCDRVPVPDFGFLHPAPAVPLKDVLPGRWKVVYKNITYTLTFGKHSDVAMVIDVPPEHRARLGVEQLWIGGNYHVENDHVLNCEFTDGRWAVLIAQLHGLKMHHVDIKSYADDKVVDGEDTTWTRIGKASAVRMGEAVDIADQAPAINDAPRPRTTSSPVKPAGGEPPGTLAQRQARLTILYKQLESTRKTLNLKDKSAVAAFNQQAADYSRQVADLNGGTTTTAAR